MDQIKIKNSKLNKSYAVKRSQSENQVKEVDLNKRIVQFIGNTYNYLDSDLDILIPGAAKDSIKDRGPQSKAIAKIKHQKDHSLSIDKSMGKPQLIEEAKISGNTVLYLESKIPETSIGNDDLIKYQEGIYDNHSIGFRYENLAYASKNSDDEDHRKRYDKYIKDIINPELAEENGYFWVVKKIDLFEVSTVSFGANSLTGVLGVKSKNKESVIFEMNQRFEFAMKMLNSGKMSENQIYDLRLELDQIKAITNELFVEKEDLKKEELNTINKNNDFKELIGSINEFHKYL